MALKIRNLDTFRPAGTVPYTLNGIMVGSDRPAVLLLKHAGDGNAAWANARKKIDAVRGAQLGGRLTVADLLPAFCRTCVVGWENVIDDDTGKPAPYVAEECIKLLMSLVETDRTDLAGAPLLFAQDPSNFSDAQPLSAEVAVGLGKG